MRAVKWIGSNSGLRSNYLEHWTVHRQHILADKDYQENSLHVVTHSTAEWLGDSWGIVKIISWGAVQTSEAAYRKVAHVGLVQITVSL